MSKHPTLRQHDPNKTGLYRYARKKHFPKSPPGRPPRQFRPIETAVASECFGCGGTYGSLRYQVRGSGEKAEYRLMEEYAGGVVEAGWEMRYIPLWEAKFPHPGGVRRRTTHRWIPCMDQAAENLFGGINGI